VTDEAPARRIADQDRDRVIVELREHCVAGRLTLEEFAHRTDQTIAARTEQDLEAVMRDLPSDERPSEPKLGARTQMMLIGGIERRGRWRVPERLRVVGLIGGIELDLTDAVIENDEPVIESWLVIGGMEITVPEGIEVEVEGVTVLGGTENESPGRHMSGGPRVRVRHFALIGGTEVKVRRA
jgi:predicted membrane protein